MLLPIGSMYAIYDNIYHQYTPNVSIYTIHGSYGLYILTYNHSAITHCHIYIYIYYYLIVFGHQIPCFSR